MVAPYYLPTREEANALQNNLDSGSMIRSPWKLADKIIADDLSFIAVYGYMCGYGNIAICNHHTSPSNCVDNHQLERQGKSSSTSNHIDNWIDNRQLERLTILATDSAIPNVLKDINHHYVTTTKQNTEFVFDSKPIITPSNPIDEYTDHLTVFDIYLVAQALYKLIVVNSSEPLTLYKMDSREGLQLLNMLVTKTQSIYSSLYLIL